MITQISAVAGYMGYAGIVLAVLMTRSRRLLLVFTRAASRCWGPWLLLGAWGRAGSDRAAQRIEGFETRHLPVWSTAGGCLLGLCVYYAWCKRLKEGQGRRRHQPPTNKTIRMNEISGQTNVRSARFGAGASEGLGRELGRFLVTTMEVPWGLVKERLGADPAQVLMVENMQIETIERQLEKVGEVDAVLGIGGAGH